MAADDKNTISLDLTAGDTKDVLNALKSIVKGLDTLNTSVVELQKTGGISPVMERSAKSADEASKSIKKASGAIDDTAEASLKAKGSVDRYTGSVDRATSGMDEFGNSARGMANGLGESTTTGLKSAKQFAKVIDDLNQKIIAANQTIKSSRTELVSTTDLKRQKELSLAINQSNKNIKRFQDELEAVRTSQSQVLRGITAEFTSPLTSVEKLIKLADKFNEKQEKGSAKIDKMRSTSAKNLADFTKQAAAIEDTIKKTSDPALIDVLTKRLTVVNDKIKSMKSLMTTEEVLVFWKEQSREASELANNIKDDVAVVLDLRKQYEELVLARQKASDPTVAKALDEQIEKTQDRIQDVVEGIGTEDTANFITEMGKQAGETGKSIELLQLEVAKLTREKKEQEKAFASTNDPFIKGLAQAKYKEITEELDKQNKALQEQQMLKRTTIGGGAAIGVGGKNEKASTAAKEVSTFISSAKAMGDSIGLTSMFASKYTSTIDYQGQVLSKNSIEIGNLVNGLSQTFETASSRFKQTTDLQQQLAGLGDSFSNWGSKVTSNNKSILDAGGKLSGFQKMLGGVAGQAKGVTSLMGGLAKGLGVVGAFATAVQAGFEIFDRLTGKSSEDIAKRIDALREESRVTQDLNELIRAGSVEAITRQKQAIQDQIQALKDQSDALKDAAVNNTSTFDQIRTILGSSINDLTNGLIGGTQIYGETGDALKDVNGEISKLDKQLKRLSDGGLVDATRRVAELNAIAEKAKDALSELSRQEEALLDARVEAVKNQNKLKDDLQAESDQYNQDVIDTQIARDKQQKDDLAAHLEDLETLETDYNKAQLDGYHDHLKELRKNEQDYIAESQQANEDLLKSLSDEQAEFNKQKAKDDIDFEKDKQKDYISYQKRIAKMEEDYNKEKIQRQKDLQQSLFEAELDNDALQFFKLQREGEKADAEAAEAYSESRAEEQKAFEEDQAEKAAQRAEEKAQNEIDFRERQEQEKQQALEAQAERDARYQEELIANKAAFAAKQEEEAYQYAESRAANVEAFKKKQEDQALANAQEDSDRLEQTEKRRKALLDNYNKELEYFQQREALLTGYIQSLSNVRDKFKSIEDIVSSGDFGNKENYDAVMAVIQPEIDRLTRITDRKDYEDKELERLTNLIKDGVQGQITSEDQQALTTAINNLNNSAIAAANSEYSTKLKYQNPEDYAAYQTQGSRSPDQTVTDLLKSALSNVTGNYVLTNNGLLTKNEVTEQAKRDLELSKQYDGKSLNQMKDASDKEYTVATTGFAKKKDALDTANNDEINSLSDHFYQTGDLLDTANQSELDKDTAHYDASGMLLDTANQANLDKYTGHYGAIGEATDEFGNALEEGVGGAYDKTAKRVVQVSESGTILAAAAYSRLANQIVSSATSALGRIQAMSNSLGSSSGLLGYRSPSSSSGSTVLGSSIRSSIVSGGGGRARPVFAAKGAFISKPTAVVAGEGRKPEVIFPFDKSKGIPDDILKKMGKGVERLPYGNGGINAKNQPQGGFIPTNQKGSVPCKDNLPYPNPSSPHGGTFETLAAVMGKMKNAGMDMSIGSVQVGSNISREEIRQQFADLQTTILQLISKSING